MLLHTFLKHLHVAELLQHVAVVIVGDVDFIIFSLGVLHPRSLSTPIGVVGDRLRDG